MNEFIIKDYLLSKGFKMSRRGFHMIADSVSIYNPDIKLEALYVDLARKYGVDYKDIERCIRYAKNETDFADFVNKEMLATIKYDIEKLIAMKGENK